MGVFLSLNRLPRLIQMTIDTADIFGSDQVGIHLACVGQCVFHPAELTDPIKQKIDSVLGLESIELSIGGSNLIGALLSGNSHGMAVADIATEADLDILTSYGDVIVMEGGVNTAGNLLLANESGVVASPSIPEEGLEIISEVMKVDVTATTIAGQDVVGSLGVTNDQGILLHPDVTPEEVIQIEQVMKVSPMVGTACFGSPYVGAGICASNNGALAGSETTGPEMNRIEDALGLI
ncbi:MAG TPA: translation initiation factor IF-6 [Candidatus Poseidoniales archaeon]|nr:MAG TPA: translation initiation factor IF-6 [Candidatus Poseidoniales archaeon]|tara:strand:- start:255 stop:962 length:708 start_codon:yes stop_codon:yes gene_type:complete